MNFANKINTLRVRPKEVKKIFKFNYPEHVITENLAL